MEERNYIVYKHTTPNSKVYIGITKQKPSQRWQNGKGYRGQLFYNAIEKYGWSNIKHEIIASGLTKEEAENMEIELITKYKSNERKFGYNVDKGGNLNKEVSEETKRKISKAISGERNGNYKGKSMTQKQKQEISERMKGENNPNFGKKMSDEQKQKISRARKKQVGVNAPRTKKVYCEGIVFNCLKDCAEFYNVPRTTMGNWLLGRYTMPQNFVEKGLKYYN